MTLITVIPAQAVVRHYGIQVSGILGPRLRGDDGFRHGYDICRWLP